MTVVSIYRAIATDLDGTLLGSDGRISERTRVAVLGAEDAGLAVVIATGRPPRWIAPIVDQLGEGAVLKNAVNYQRLAQTAGLPRDNH